MSRRHKEFRSESGELETRKKGVYQRAVLPRKVMAIGYLLLGFLWMIPLSRAFGMGAPQEQPTSEELNSASGFKAPLTTAFDVRETVIQLRHRMQEANQVRQDAFREAKAALMEAQVGSSELGRIASLMVDLDPRAAAPVIARKVHRLKIPDSEYDQAHLERRFPLLVPLKEAQLDGLAATMQVVCDPTEELTEEQLTLYADA
jgi:hypothetical protein